MDAYFKIVQTVENNEKKLCVVPSAWENAGKLKWPPIDPKKAASISWARKLLNDVNSVPGQDWEEIECSLKRAHFPTKKAAEAIIKSMMPNSDTSSNESDMVKMMPPPSDSNRPKRKIAIVSKKNADSGRNDFSNMVRVGTHVCFAFEFQFFVHFVILQATVLSNCRVMNATQTLSSMNQQ